MFQREPAKVQTIHLVSASLKGPLSTLSVGVCLCTFYVKGSTTLFPPGKILVLVISIGQTWIRLEIHPTLLPPPEESEQQYSTSPANPIWIYLCYSAHSPLPKSSSLIGNKVNHYLLKRWLLFNLVHILATDAHGLFSNPIHQPIRPSYFIFEKTIPVSLPKLSKTAESEILLYLQGNMLAWHSFVDAAKKKLCDSKQ